MKTFLLGFLLGVLCLPVGILAYFKYGKPPVATADPKLPFEKQLVRVPLHARIEAEMPRSVPLAAEPAALSAGADIYQAQCAACHGLPAHASSFAKGMFPRAPQLFVRHGDHVGVSDDPPGEIYWKVKNGIRLTGMPAYQQVLSEAQMWQVTLLLSNADKLPPIVEQRLAPSPASAATPTGNSVPGSTGTGVSAGSL
jgi:mono/diheme cytochrome c family protein